MFSYLLVFSSRKRKNYETRSRLKGLCGSESLPKSLGGTLIFSFSLAWWMSNAINDFCLLNFGISIHAMSISIRTVYFYQREIIKKKKDYLWVKLISCLGAFSLLKNLRFLFYFTCTFSFPPNWSGSAILSKKCCLADFLITFFNFNLLWLFKFDARYFWILFNSHLPIVTVAKLIPIQLIE